MPRHAPPLFALLFCALLLLTGCGVDSEQAALCRKLIPAFDSGPVTQVDAVETPGDEPSVRLTYRVGADEHWIDCRFGGRFFDERRHELVSVATDRSGTLTDIHFTMLRVWARLPYARIGLPPDSTGARPAAGPREWGALLFFLQQVINAATVACVYGLLALGYTLVYGILGQINLAMGELTMIGAMVTAMGAAALGMAGLGSMPLAVLGVLATVMAFTAVQGWTMEKLVFQRLRRVHSHTPLIAAVGLSVAYQEGMRLLHGARDWWPAPILADRHELFSDGTFTVTALTSQGVILLMTAGLYALLWAIMQRTAYGRAHRACADDVEAAELVGVDVDRTVSTTFAVGGALAAAAGAVIALYYGGVNFYTGYLVGFKALAAAVVGGIGSVPGAMLGGALLGLVETFWSAYFAIAYKDIVAFGLLTLFLIYRPHGLLGKDRSRGD
ncbi:branched-chain amino acid ABC transporter permease [Azospirillum canadense]|uniref:branched-chain amino acid ABC transporter permease n=1 Tax=Azospirillum canadense TaxID=403962 RepID=UPI00222717CA|nr:branched-chain amino acid ABC transporter permease [Azospirillum canadense]MCW2237879.1 branched-chain amino acid transport system permease protein [Azospirillum canadense]